MESYCKQLALPLRQFISSRDFEHNIISNLSQRDIGRFIVVIIFYQLTPNLLNLLSQRPTNYASYLKEFRKFNLESSTAHCLIKILQATSA